MPDTAIALVEGAAARLAVLLDVYAPPPGERPVCRAGCGWCCHVQVAVAAPEALRIAEHLRRALPARELDQVAARIARLDDRTRGLDADARAATGLPCALLVDGRCVVYPVRPLLCRGWNSLDAAACRANALDPDSVPVPTCELHRQLAGHVALGLDDGLWDAGLGEASLDLELTTALRIALEVPDAAARWLGGEPVFAPAGAR